MSYMTQLTLPCGHNRAIVTDEPLEDVGQAFDLSDAMGPCTLCAHKREVIASQN